MANMAFGSTLNPVANKRERLAVAGAAVGFTADNYTVAATEKNSKRLAGGAMLQITGADSIYYTIDGSTPSSSVGFESAPGDIIYLDSFQKVSNFRAIQKTTATSIEAVFLFGN